MKKFEIRKEVFIWIIMLMPIAYLCYVWNILPEMVPTHFDGKGEPNDWSHKSTLALLIPGLLVGIYALLTSVPAIDPKGKIEAMGNKFYTLKLFLMLFISAICFFIIQSAISKKIDNVNSLFLLIGALFAFLGNYMQTVKPNYFIGIRTPWTLENEEVWRKTHKIGGKVFFVVGLLIMVLPYVLKDKFQVVLMPMILIAAFVPIIYSFICFRQEKNKAEEK